LSLGGQKLSLTASDSPPALSNSGQGITPRIATDHCLAPFTRQPKTRLTAQTVRLLFRVKGARQSVVSLAAMRGVMPFPCAVFVVSGVCWLKKRLARRRQP